MNTGITNNTSVHKIRLSMVSLEMEIKAVHTCISQANVCNTSVNYQSRNTDPQISHHKCDCQKLTSVIFRSSAGTSTAKSHQYRHSNTMSSFIHVSMNENTPFLVNYYSLFQVVHRLLRGPMAITFQHHFLDHS